MVRICVLGAGINGLSSATHVQRACPHADVTIIAEKFTPNTTSDVSAGFWGPFFSINNEYRIDKWGKRTYDYLIDLATSCESKDTGAQIVFAYLMNNMADDIEAAGKTRDYVKCFRQMTPDELALFSQARYGVFFMSVVLDCVTYLPWLTKRFLENGGTIKQERLDSLAQVANDFDVIINCTALGARPLVNDDSLVPNRGQVLKVKAPWLKFAMGNVTDKGEAYILPGAKFATVGGVFDENNWDANISERDSQMIWNRCVELFPQLTGATVVKSVSGLRPTRPRVRLELERMTFTKTLPVVHNYGHGGAGVSLFEGCAEDVADIVTSLPECQVHSKL